MKVTMRYVQAIELGQQNLSLGSLLKVARALGVEVAVLFEKAQPRTPRPGRPRRR
jgi:transcriptional regulator with XRE-family HTH domain